MNRILLLLLLPLLLAQGHVVAQSARSAWTTVSFSRSSNIAVTAPENKTMQEDALLDNIPAGKKHPERYALIIGNEQYAKSGLGLINVDYARRDARLFRGYALRYWGIPENNIFHLEDATAGIMHAYI